MAGNTPFEKIRFLVSGRVQGVCFRAYCEAAAAELDVTGWVRNCPDGRVEGEAFGTEDAIKDFIRWLKKGSPHGRVDTVDLEHPGPVEERPPNFGIRYG